MRQPVEEEHHRRDREAGELQEIGTGAPARADDVLGFHGPGSLMWRINREAVVLAAGQAALLLQIAHPLVAEGVAHHSTFQQAPFRRLRSTLRTTMDLVFGDGPTAERAVRRLNAVHAAIRGETRDPHARSIAAAEYRALDPALLLWVQATLVVTSVHAYRRWVGPLTDDELERYWWEARSVGMRLGIPGSVSPSSWNALLEYWDRMLRPGGPVTVTSTARRLSGPILRPPVPGLPGRLADLAALPGFALLPAHLREAFGIPWSARQERFSRATARVLRLWTRWLPRTWRSLPEARAADARVARAARARAARVARRPGW